MIVFSVGMLFIGPNLISEGMFIDGVTYASISKNLANGLGDFWHLHYTQTLYNQFFEHPPLAFGMQASFFKLFGENY